MNVIFVSAAEIVAVTLFNNRKGVNSTPLREPTTSSERTYPKSQIFAQTTGEHLFLLQFL
jgi:hypothetical protein